MSSLETLLRQPCQPEEDEAELMMEYRIQEIRELRNDLKNLNISGTASVIVKNEGINPTTDVNTLVDIADWEHLRPLFQHLKNPAPPIFRDPMFQQAPMFIKNLEDFLKTNQIAPDQYLTLAKTLFRGPSNNWREFHESKWKTYDDFRRSFLSKYWSQHEQLKERQRLREKKYVNRRHSSHKGFFLLLINKFRFFNPQLREEEILNEIMNLYPPDIQSQWAVMTPKTILTALSFFSQNETIYRDIDASGEQNLNNQLCDIHLLDNKVQVKVEEEDSSAYSNERKYFMLDFMPPQHATFIVDDLISPPVFKKADHPVRFIKDLEEYFSKVPVEDKLDLTLQLLNSVKSWRNRNQYRWTSFEDLRWDFLNHYWSTERLTSECIALASLKYVPTPTNDMVDFFISTVNRYRYLQPPMAEDQILLTVVEKYPIEIQTLWTASGCETIMETVTFLQRQDELGIINTLTDHYNDVKNRNVKWNSQNSSIQQLKREMDNLHISDISDMNNVVKNEDYVKSEFISDDSSQQQMCETVKMKLSPPIFKNKYVQNPAQFMKKLHEFFSLAQISEEYELLFVKSLLQDKMVEWREFHERNWANLSDFRRDFYASFWSKHKQNGIREKIKQGKFVPGRKNDSVTRFFLNQVRAYRLFDPPVPEDEILKEVMQQYPVNIVSAWASVSRKNLDSAFLFLEKMEMKDNTPHLKPLPDNSRLRHVGTPYFAGAKNPGLPGSRENNPFVRRRNNNNRSRKMKNRRYYT